MEMTKEEYLRLLNGTSVIVTVTFLDKIRYIGVISPNEKIEAEYNMMIPSGKELYEWFRNYSFNIKELNEIKRIVNNWEDGLKNRFIEDIDSKIEINEWY